MKRRIKTRRTFVGRAAVSAVAVELIDFEPYEKDGDLRYVPQATLTATAGGQILAIHLGGDRDEQKACLKEIAKVVRQAIADVDEMWDRHDLEVATGKRKAAEDDDFYPF